MVAEGADTHSHHCFGWVSEGGWPAIGQGMGSWLRSKEQVGSHKKAMPWSCKPRAWGMGPSAEGPPSPWGPTAHCPASLDEQLEAWPLTP